MRLFRSDLLVGLADHLRLDHRQQLRDRQRCNAQRAAHGEGRAHVPAQNRAGDCPQLAAEAGGQIPDLPALMALRRVQPRGVVAAAPEAGGTISVAAAEVPFGEGAEAFFSESSTR